MAGEEEYFPLINGFHYKYYTSDVGGARNDFLFFRFDTVIEKRFLIGEHAVNYFKRLINLNREQLLEEVRKSLPSRYDELKMWPREWIISKLVYEYSKHTPKDRIFLLYGGHFPIDSYNSFPLVTYFYKNHDFIYYLTPEKITGDWDIDQQILRKCKDKTIFLPLNLSKVKSWIISTERGNLILGYVYGEDPVKIWNGKTLKEFKCIQVRTRAIRRKGFKFMPPEVKTWLAPGIGIILEVFGMEGECRFSQLIQYFRPDTEERWRYGLKRKDLEGYHFRKNLDEVEKAWEEKGFKVFYLQEWPEEDKQNKSKK